MKRTTMLLAMMCCAGAAAGPVRAQEPATGPIRIELNRLEAAGGDCRATVVVENGPVALASLKLDLVIFDGEGIVAKRIAAELAPLARGKTVVKTFPVAGLACPDVSRVLVNEIMSCTTDAGPAPDCMDRIETASRTPARFSK